MFKVKVESDAGMSCKSTVKGHDIYLDQLEEHGGKNLGPCPVDYLVMALAGCKIMVARGFAQNNNVDLGKISCEVSLDTEQKGAKDFTVHMQFEHLPEEMRPKLERYLDFCTVANVLEQANNIHTTVEALS